MQTGTPDQTVYTFETKQGERREEWTRDYDEAVIFASEHQLMLIENEYEWSDSNLVGDFTPGGEDAAPEEDETDDEAADE
jgi:hypothetical protein